MNIVLIGSGNVATQLGLALKKVNHKIVQVYSRTPKSARLLALKLRADAITDITLLTTKADLYIIAIKDDAVIKLTKKLPLKDKLIVHTSGTLPLSILKKPSNICGVLYPLQTLSKNKTIDFSNVPLCIEGNTKQVETELLKMAKSITKKVYLVNSEKRKTIHLAAVFACNFSNHMYTLAYLTLKKNKLPFDLLLPLIQETTTKLNFGNPIQMQTGPAIRKDKSIMNTHLKMLSTEKILQKLYKLISKSIIQNKV